MVYILFGSQELMIKRRLKKIIDEFFKDEDKNVIELDASSTSIQMVVDEAEQMSLTSPKKVIVYKDASFLSSKKTIKTSYKNDYEVFERYLDFSDDDTLIVLITIADSLLQTNKIFKKIKEKGKVFELKEPTLSDWDKYIKQYFLKRNIDISQDAVNEITNRCESNLNIFENEANKLVFLGKEKICIDDVKNIVTKPLENNSFNLLNELFLGHGDEAIKIYRDLKTNGVEVVTLISLITSSLIFMDQVSILLKLGNDVKEIAQELGVSTYRVMANIKSLKKIKEGKIKTTLSELYKLDYKIKHNKIDRFYGFEMFLIKFN